MTPPVPLVPASLERVVKVGEKIGKQETGLGEYTAGGRN